MDRRYPGPPTSEFMNQVYKWILQLGDREMRGVALQELYRHRDEIPSDVAIYLWNSFGTVASLLQEIVEIYPTLNPSKINLQQVNRVCNTMALLQWVASHPETKFDFLIAQIPMYLYPFIRNNLSPEQPFEYLRLTTLGVFGSLVKYSDPEVVNFLLETEMIPMCLRIMETGADLTKTVACFILQRILVDDQGLKYVCSTYERFSQVAFALGNLVIGLLSAPSTRLLKHVVRCYHRLADNQRAREALRNSLPYQLRDGSFMSPNQADLSITTGLSDLLYILDMDHPR